MDDQGLARFTILTAVFVAALVTANVVAGKIVSLWGVFVPAGVLAYSVTFAITDTVCEIWGRARTQTLVNSGFLVLLAVWGLIALAIALPAAPFWQGQPAFSAVLASTNRIILASLIAYGISQTFDVWLFHRIKRRFGARRLWLRNNVSTFLSQTVDTVLFISIAFWGEFPLLPLMVGQLTVKYTIALLDTPIVYGLVALLRPSAAQTASPHA